MSVELEFLGTGDARRMPVYGCICRACRLAQAQPARVRQACSALLSCQGYRLMLDAGRTDLCERFPPGSLDGVLLTHYHMDHVMGLFHLRWGLGPRLPVFGPADPLGCDDLFKHPGMLEFQEPLQPFKSCEIGPFQVVPLPLKHSRLTHGYLISAEGHSLAYLTDTVGLPADTRDYLLRRRPDMLVLDCSEPPRDTPPRNHNDLGLALALVAEVGAGQSWLTHVGHRLDDYWLDHPQLPAGVEVAWDGHCVDLGSGTAVAAIARSSLEQQHE